MNHPDLSPVIKLGDDVRAHMKVSFLFGRKFRNSGQCNKFLINFRAKSCKVVMKSKFTINQITQKFF